jgi:lysophospholipase L1-like esterase
MKRLLLGLSFIICQLSFCFAQQSANIVFIGNSITYGALHKNRDVTAPPVQCGLWLSQQEGIDTVYISNGGRSGRTTYHFLPNAADVIPAGDKTFFSDIVSRANQLVKAHPGLPLVFSIMLGTNDSVERKHNSHTTPDNYINNLCTIIDSLLTLWPDAHVVLNKPIWYYPDYQTKGGSIASKKSLKLLDTYYDCFAKIVARCKAGQVHIGDHEAYGYFKSHYKSDVFEEKDARGKSYWLHPNEQGAKQLAAYWGKAILPVIKSIPVHPLYGKKIGVIGDSYVRNHRDPIEYTWHYKFAQKYGMQYYNYGKNGNCIALDLKQWGTGMYKRYQDMNDSLDYVVIIAGHNDASGNRIDSIGMPLFKERLGILLSGLRTKYPNGQIFFITPWRCENFQGSMRQQVIEAIKEVCAKYDVPVFDASRDSNIESDNFDFRKKYFQGGKGTDTAHLNAKGHDLFLPVAEQFLLQHIK